MPGPDRLEHAADITTHEWIQGFEFARDLDSSRFATTPYWSRATPETQVENHAIRAIFQRPLVPDEIAVVVDRDFIEQDQQRDRDHVVGRVGPLGGGRGQQITTERNQAGGVAREMGAGMIVHEDLGFEPRRQEPIRATRFGTEQEASEFEMAAHTFERRP